MVISCKYSGNSGAGGDLFVAGGAQMYTNPRGTGGRVSVYSGASAAGSSGALVLSTANAGMRIPYRNHTIPCHNQTRSY